MSERVECHVCAGERRVWGTFYYEGHEDERQGDCPYCDGAGDVMSSAVVRDSAG